MPKKMKARSGCNADDAQLAKVIRLLTKIEEHLDYIADVVEGELDSKQEQASAQEQNPHGGLIEQIAPMLLGAMQGMRQEPAHQLSQMPQAPQMPIPPSNNPFVVPPMPNDNPFSEP